ncbi:MAG: VCBS repeat-containing protein [Sandaracinaceae bacterium]|jgi:hypothetical protein|nr:VCBS repeat-containing protein [Sandaracinaceae bacterium]
MSTRTPLLAVLMLVAFSGVIGCSDDPSLTVLVKTDLVAGVEFTRVVVEVRGDEGSGEGASLLADNAMTATRSMRFVPERRVASFALEAGRELIVTVRLLDARGGIVVERPTRMTVTSDFALRVVLTRNCARVACPSPGGDAISAACFNGRCVDDRCQPDAPEFCPAVACTADATPPTDCLVTASCASARCEDGVCLYVEPTSSVCSTSEYCDPFRGCESIDPLDDGGVPIDGTMDDASLLDASLLDGTMDDASSPDAFIALDMSTDGSSSEDAMSCGDLNSDVHHCGDCSTDCTALPNVDGALVSCESGRCVLSGACAAGYSHCTGNPLDGCETDTSTATQCGDCTTACDMSAPVCTRGTGGTYGCASGCGGLTPTRCGATCVNLDTDPIACGSCSHVCPSSDHGHATCSARACGIACDFGYHLCGSVCVSDASILSCGTSCTTCPGAPPFAMATCDGASCGFECQPGYNLCGGVCVATNSVSACGPACLVCSPPPSNGSAYCDGVTCSTTCNPEFNSCSGACVASTDPTHCGVACTACATPLNGNATCDGTSCGITCSTGFHACGSACASNTATATCGSTCDSPCTAPTNGTATCNGLLCGFTCNAGYTPAGGGCDIAAPRPIRPIHSSVVTSRTPQLRWQLGAGTTGATVDICMDRACASVVSTMSVVGSSYTPASPLAPGLYFWRTRGRLGASTGTVSSPVWEFTVGARSAAVDTTYGNGLRDVDGDGYADVVVNNFFYTGATGVTIFRGRPAGLPSMPDYALMAPVGGNAFFGCASTLTDVNRDGYADVLVGDSGYNGYVGRVSVYYGSASGPSLTPSLIIDAPPTMGPAAQFGVAFASAGDVNGDGFGDVLILSAGSSRAYLYEGSATGIASTPTTTISDAGANAYHYRVVTGDFNGDGYSDIAAMHPVNSNTNFFYGGPAGLSSAPSTPITIGGAVVRTAAAGDVDGDGYSDVVVSTVSLLHLYLFRGGPAGIASVPSETIDAPAGSSSSFGRQLAIPGDLNGDGYADVVAGDLTYLGGSLDEGRAMIYLGSSAGLAVSPNQIITSPLGGSARFSHDVGSIGDIDGDGRADVMITTVQESVYLYLGIAGALGVAPTPSLGLSAPPGFSGPTWGATTAFQ